MIRVCAGTLAVPVERVCESGLLSRVEGQVVIVLDFNPGNNIGALEGVKRGEPSGGVLVAFGLVKIVCDSNELRSSEVVGKLLAPSGSPRAGAANPSFL